MRLVALAVLFGCSLYQIQHTRSCVTAFLLWKQQCYVSRREPIANGNYLNFRKSHLSSCSREEDGTSSKNDDDDNVEEENSTSIYPWRYRILKYYNNPISTQHGQCTQFQGTRHHERLQLQYDDDNKDRSSQTTIFLPEALLRMDPDEFPTVSQARKACRLGRVLVLRKINASSAYNENFTYIPSNGTKFMPYRRGELHEESPRVVNPTLLENWENVIREIFGENYSDKSLVRPFLGHITCRLDCGDVVAIHTRVHDEFYPPSITNYILPPDGICNLFDNDSNGRVVVYEDDFLAIVNKPENVTTIGGAGGSRDGDGARNDLQSMLGFILYPPPRLSTKQVKHACDPYLPRPVHRLDRRTSGLVLVAKTQEVMRRLSSFFESICGA